MLIESSASFDCLFAAFTMARFGSLLTWLWEWNGWNASDDSYYGLGSSLPLSLWMWLGNRRVMRNVQMEMNKKNRYMFHWDWKGKKSCGLYRCPLTMAWLGLTSISFSIRSDWLLVVYRSFLLEFHTIDPWAIQVVSRVSFDRKNRPHWKRCRSWSPCRIWALSSFRMKTVDWHS